MTPQIEVGMVTLLGEPWFVCSGATLTMPVLLRLALDDGGAPVCRGLLLGLTLNPTADGTVTLDFLDQQITASVLRLPLGALVRAVVAHPVFREHFLAGLPRARRAPRLPARRRPGRAGHPDDFYAEFAADAEIERRRRAPRSPVPALARRYRVSEPTIRRWLAAVRARGHRPDNVEVGP